MCLIAFQWQPGSDRPLIVAANRDELHARPTRALCWWRWPDGPLAGIDEQAGGTWMAVSRQGRFAAVTNFRVADSGRGRRSRGELPTAWTEGESSPESFAQQVYRRRGEYAPFNLLAGGPDALWIVGTHASPEPVSPGIHALSNHLLDTPWPKSIRAVRRMRDWIDDDGADMDALLDLLYDRQPAPVDELPDTGVGSKIERMLSPPFIVSERYGTRSSTALVLGRRNRMAERCFDVGGSPVGERTFTWSGERCNDGAQKSPALGGAFASR